MTDILRSYGIDAAGNAVPISNPGANVAEDSLKLGGKPASNYMQTENILSTIEEAEASTNGIDVVGANVLKEFLAAKSSELITNLPEGTIGINKCTVKNGVCTFGFQLHSFSNSSVTTGTTIATLPEGFRPVEITYCNGAAIRDGVCVPVFYSIYPNGTIHQHYSNTGTFSQFSFCGSFPI